MPFNIPSYYSHSTIQEDPHLFISHYIKLLFTGIFYRGLKTPHVELKVVRNQFNIGGKLWRAILNVAIMETNLSPKQF